MEHSTFASVTWAKTKGSLHCALSFQTSVCLSHGVLIGVSVCLAMCTYICEQRWRDSMNFITPVIHCENINKNDESENFKINNISIKVQITFGNYYYYCIVCMQAYVKGQWCEVCYYFYSLFPNKELASTTCCFLIQTLTGSRSETVIITWQKEL